MKVRFELNPKQDDCLYSAANEILYGGAAGGGKSYLLRIAAIIFCMQVPNLQVYLFRRTYPDLMANHMNGSACFPELLAPLLATGQCRLNYSASEIVFDNGSKIHLCHCQHEKDVIKYQGAEIHVLLIDELTHFTEYIYRFLRNRVRLGGLHVGDLRGKLPLILNASNPGSVGHAWVKESFVNFAQPMEVKKAPDMEGGMLRQYIPAKLDDNPVLTMNDPGYLQRLEGLGNEALVKAMRDGDWDITAGTALEKLSRDVHMIRPFEPPDYLTKFTSLDWGTARPYACGWYCILDQDLILKPKDNWPERLLPTGSIILYRELYGFGGVADTGTREESYEVARKIHATEENESIDYRIADSAMWSEHDGPSSIERMEGELKALNDGCPYFERSRKGRQQNYLEIRTRLANAYEVDKPAVYITSNCQHFWRTVPELQLDERHPDKGWSTDQEDHHADQFAYALASRPIVYTELERNREEYDWAKRQAHKAVHNNAHSSYYE